jgi:hypothetical protein
MGDDPGAVVGDGGDDIQSWFRFYPNIPQSQAHDERVVGRVHEKGTHPSVPQKLLRIGDPVKVQGGIEGGIAKVEIFMETSDVCILVQGGARLSQRAHVLGNFIRDARVTNFGVTVYQGRATKHVRCKIKHQKTGNRIAYNRNATIPKVRA